MKIRLLVAVVLGVLLFATPIQAKADSLVIQEDGMVVLFVDNGVLGVSIADSSSAKSTPAPAPAKAAPAAPPAPSKPAPSQPSTPPKAVPIVPPNTPSTVQTTPSPKGNNKLQVTITSPAITTPAPSTQPSSAGSTQNTTTAKPSSSPTTNSTSSTANSTSPTTNSTTPQSSSNPSTVNKDVDKVVLESAPNTPILTIQSNSSNQSTQTVQQGNTTISTSLPLNIDTQTRTVSAVLSSGPVKLNVLPDQAVTSVVTQNLVSNPQVSLEESNHQPVYSVTGEKSGLLFGVYPISSPVNVKMSAQTGTVVSIDESVPFKLFGFLIR